jgi:hypothetical protein
MRPKGDKINHSYPPHHRSNIVPKLFVLRSIAILIVLTIPWLLWIAYEYTNSDILNYYNGSSSRRKTLLMIWNEDRNLSSMRFSSSASSSTTTSQASSKLSLDITFDPSLKIDITTEQQNNETYKQGFKVFDASFDHDHSDVILPYCTREQIRLGRWIPVVYEHPPYVSKTKHLRCPPIYHGKNTMEDHNETTSWHTYDWVPYDSSRISHHLPYSSSSQLEARVNASFPLYDYDIVDTNVNRNEGNRMEKNLDHDKNSNTNACIFLQWNQSDFCQNVLPTGTISIIGDSLSWEQYSSLLQLLGQRVKQTSQFISKKQYQNHIQYACHQSKATPSTSAKFVYRNLSKPNGTSVFDSIQQDFPMIIVLNRGAHYVNDTLLVQDMISIISVIEQWQHQCQEHYNITCYFFYRTTVPGHVQCEQFQQPVHDYYGMKQYTENISHYNNTTFEYHWYDFDHQNQLVLNLLEQSNLSQYMILDAYDVALLRPDRHRFYQGKFV